MKRAVAIACIGLALAGCEREKREFVKPLTEPSALAKADALVEQPAGQPGPGMKATRSAGGYNESSAYEVAQGKQWYRWYNCNGCHAQGGGSIGPALMDDQWIYGSKPDEIFTTIMEGRQNGMPAFKGRIPEAQAWQIVAYVRSMSGLVSGEAAPNRAEGMLGAPPEGRRKPQRPEVKSK